MGRVPQALYSTLTNSLPNVIAMYGMTIAMKFKKNATWCQSSKKKLLLDVWGWFIITTAAGIAAAAKNFAVQALHGNSPRSNIKIRLSKMLRELNKYVTLCGNKVQVSSKKHLFHEIIEITMLKPKPYGPMALDDYAQSVALALQYVT